MKSIIAIDGGGSKSNYALFDLDRETIFAITGAAANILVKDTNQVAADLFYLIERCIDKYNLKDEEVEAVIIGAAGAEETSAEQFRKSFNDYALSKGKVFKRMIIESDIRIALEGAHGGNSGAVLIAGTGSIIAVKEDGENFLTLGGYGRIIGDEGGEYSIAKKTLNIFSKQIDGLIPKSYLFKLLSEELSLGDRGKLIDLVYSKDFNIAGLNETVIHAYEKDDNATKIINEESEELIKLLETIIVKTGTEKINLCLFGGLLENENLYSKMVQQKIRENFPNVRIKNPVHSPLEGAFILARKYISDNLTIQ